MKQPVKRPLEWVGFLVASLGASGVAVETASPWTFAFGCVCVGISASGLFMVMQ